MDNTPQPPLGKRGSTEATNSLGKRGSTEATNSLPTCVGIKALERGGVISCWNNFRVIVREYRVNW